MIVLRSPKGWTGPKVVDGLQTEGTFRSHQVPMGEVRTNPDHLALLEDWLRSYRPEELFDESGALVPELAALPPKSYRRMSANPHANGGLLLRDLVMPDFREYAVDVPRPGGDDRPRRRGSSAAFLRDVIDRNRETFRLFGPDETASNRLGAVFEVTDRAFDGEILPIDDHVATDGRVMEVLSEHLCQGWLEGYLLTGRHGVFNSYEAFIHIVDSMFNQHAKWLKVTADIPWRRPIASLNYLLSSLVWRQDHNGFSHQDPGFIDHVVNKKAEAHPGLPAARCEHAPVGRRSLPSQPELRQRRRRREAARPELAVDGRGDPALHPRHRDLGLRLERRRRRPRRRDGLRRRRPDARDAGGGRHPAARAARPEGPSRQRGRPHAPPALRPSIRTASPTPSSTRCSRRTGRSIFAYHGYPWLIHRLTYRRTNHGNIHVRGYKEEGTTTTPFDMVMLNDLDRFHLVIDVIDRVPGLAARAAHLRQRMVDRRLEARAYTRLEGEDAPEIRELDVVGAEPRVAAERAAWRPAGHRGSSSSMPARAA